MLAAARRQLGVTPTVTAASAPAAMAVPPPPTTRYAIISSARAIGFTAGQITAIKTAFDAVGIDADQLT